MGLFRAFLKRLSDRFSGKLLRGQRRSSQWPKVRAEYLKEHSRCECCDGDKKTEIHHKYPVHLFPELELEETNLVSLCEKRRCHFFVGHLLNWRSYNSNVKEDAKFWNEKIKNRPSQ